MAINFLLLSLVFLLVYAWSKELLGFWWALLPALLTLLSPHFIEESPLLTLGLLIAVFAFLRFIFHPSVSNLVVTGLALGASQAVNINTLFLYIYFLVVMGLFFIFSLVRDWQVTSPRDRWPRFRVRGLRYLRSLIIIFLISIAVFYLAQFFITKSVGGAWGLLIDRLSFQGLILHRPPPKILLTEPLPSLILVFLALIYFVISWFKSLKHFQLVPYLSNNFAEFSMIVFIFLQWHLGQTITPVLPLVYILIAEPIRNLVTNRNQKEVMIVVAHEIFSFSVKWLVLFVLLIWHLIYTFYLYSLFNYL